MKEVKEFNLDELDLSRLAKLDHLTPVKSISNKEVAVFEPTRPLSEYADSQVVSNFLDQKKKTIHIKSETLRKNGEVVQDSFEKYLGAESLGSSTIKSALKSGKDFEWAISQEKQLLDKIKEEEGKREYFKLGTFMHEAILEPTKFGRVIVEPKESKASTKGVEALIAFWEDLYKERGIEAEYIDNETGALLNCNQVLALANDRTIKEFGEISKLNHKKVYLAHLQELSGITPIKEADFIKVQRLKENFLSYAEGLLPRLLKHSKREVSIYAVDKKTGIKVKVRPDAFAFKENIGVDAIISVKTCSKANVLDFPSQAASLDYDLSEGMYQQIASEVTGRDVNATINIVFQTVEPFHVIAYFWTGYDIEIGKLKYRIALDKIAQFLEEEKYLGHEESTENGFIDMQLPNWNSAEYIPK